MNVFFVGIGGMGMSGLAKILSGRGYAIAGSDRNLDGEYCRRLHASGVKIYPQDGSGPEKFLNFNKLLSGDSIIVKSTAVEDAVPDIVSARRLGMREIMRSDLLAQLFNEKKGIAIGGTSGKTTTTGLISWMLKFAGLEPGFAVGGIISGLDTNASEGKGKYFVIEADESDGSIVKYKPYISLITNISRDHKPLNELKSLFSTFSANTQPEGVTILCADDINAMALKSELSGKVITYGFSEKSDIRADEYYLARGHSFFSVKGFDFEILLPGLHNIQNALAAIAVAEYLKIPMNIVSAALLAFPGMKRRFERVGTADGVTVIDDFAHNPAEISAAIETARKLSKNRFIVYQPHGFGPTRFTKDDLVDVFSSLNSREYLYLDEIFYAGGTVEKDISSQNIAEKVREKFANVFCPKNRPAIISDIVERASPGDMVLVMGARDINTICRPILDELTKNQKAF
ncbi:MAG: UDP-N-acetylmuramate--L-alanine ligase [Candidatus Riflebacteria bacterium]|nr:UDP-N-acetylmuramate--L-alanine ligase [Candidatus Riflebacteria bacterium]